MIKNNLPTQLNSFVGRKNELADVRERLLNNECRLLTLIGLGGSGKTRLAVEVAHAVASHFQHGVVFVGLQPLTRNDLLVSTIAQVIGLTFYGEDEPEKQLFNYLREKSLLLLLDNFEHLLDEAELISTILLHAPTVKILVTSREALNLQEEWLYPVKGMITPLSVYATSLGDYDAVQLFLYHARRIQPDFELANERESVIDICKMTAGLPLALELVASWLKGLTASQIATEIQHNLDIFSTTARNVEERHRSIRAAFDHTWKLMADDERLTFAQLSVFRGGFDREAAQQVAGATLLHLVALVEKSLINKQTADRWDMHELLRQYGEEKLASMGISENVNAAHSRYYADYMHQCELALKGSAQLDILPVIERDFDNTRVAWYWALKTQSHEIIHSMMEGLFWFGIIRSRQYDVNVLLQQASAQVAGDGADYVQARLHVRQCSLLPYDSPPHIIVERLDRSLAIIKQYGDPTEIAIGMVLLGWFLGGVEQRDFLRALQCARDSFAYFEAVGDRYYLGYALQAFVLIYYFQGQRQKAVQYAHKCAQLRREIGDRYGTARILLLVAAEAYSIPDYNKAEHFNREVRDIWQELKSWNLVSFVNVNLAYLAIFRGDFEAAHILLKDALSMAREVGIPDHIAYALAISGALASLEEHYTESWQLLSQAKERATFTSSIEALEWGLPLAACGLGDYETAKSSVYRALKYSQRLNAPGRYLWHLPAACVIIAHEDDSKRAAQIMGLIFSHPASAPAWMEKWPLLRRLRSTLEVELGTDVYQAAWKLGETLELDAVVTEVLKEFQPAQNEPSQFASQVLLEALTPREIEVLESLAAGLTNRQIAEHLIIGAGTVKTHTLNIYRKLDVANRTQAIIRAQELGLLRS
jgi:predicted ATPase/DNA-binding NarL/FixJ family response regulator